MKLLTAIIGAVTIFTGLYLCLTLGNELCISLDGMQSQINEHKNFVMEVNK